MFGEIFVIFLEEVLQVDQETIKNFLPFIGQKVQKFLCLGGVSLRARTVIAEFIEKILEFVEKPEHH